jgi:hypothetical protein
LDKQTVHIVIACSYLHVPGGYEKAVITTANLFAENGHTVTLLVLDHTADIFYPVHTPLSKNVVCKGVHTSYLNAHRQNLR